MYTVTISHECACFKKSEYESETSFQFQQEAYKYANLITEMMNEDFCQTHLFFAQLTEESNFIIGVSENPDSGSSCGTGNSDSSCGSCGC